MNSTLTSSMDHKAKNLLTHWAAVLNELLAGSWRLTMTVQVLSLAFLMTLKQIWQSDRLQKKYAASVTKNKHLRTQLHMIFDFCISRSLPMAQGNGSFHSEWCNKRLLYLHENSVRWDGWSERNRGRSLQLSHNWVSQVSLGRGRADWIVVFRSFVLGLLFFPWHSTHWQHFSPRGEGVRVRDEEWKRKRKRKFYLPSRLNNRVYKQLESYTRQGKCARF
jgi:hypothetical protein